MVPVSQRGTYAGSFRVTWREGIPLAIIQCTRQSAPSHPFVVGRNAVELKATPCAGSGTHASTLATRPGASVWARGLARFLIAISLSGKAVMRLSLAGRCGSGQDAVELGKATAGGMESAFATRPPWRGHCNRRRQCESWGYAQACPSIPLWKTSRHTQTPSRHSPWKQHPA